MNHTPIWAVFRYLSSAEALSYCTCGDQHTRNSETAPGSQKEHGWSQRENTSLLWEHAPLGASESNDIFKNAILGGGRNITIQLCLNILRLSLRPLHQFFFSLQQWNRIDKVNFFTLKFNLSLVFLSKENAFCCSQPSPAIYHFIW